MGRTPGAVAASAGWNKQRLAACALVVLDCVRRAEKFSITQVIRVVEDDSVCGPLPGVADTAEVS